MPIKQFGICSVKILLQRETGNLQVLHVVEYSTAIIGISDSEKLDLVKVNFDVIERRTQLKLSTV